MKSIFTFRHKSFIKYGDPINPSEFPSDMKKSEKIAKVMELLEERTNTLQKEVTYIANKANKK